MHFLLNLIIKSRPQVQPGRHQNKNTNAALFTSYFCHLSTENWGLIITFKPIPRSSESMLKYPCWFDGGSDMLSSVSVFLSGRKRVKGTMCWSGDCFGARDTGVPLCWERKRVYPSASSTSLKVQSESVGCLWKKPNKTHIQRRMWTLTNANAFVCFM